MSVVAQQRSRPVARRWRTPRFLQTGRGIVGLGMLAFVVGVAVIGPIVAPHPLDAPIGDPASPPSWSAPFGTDMLGRDVLSRVLHGGLSVLTISVASVALTYAIALAVGMVAGLSRARGADALLMRFVDLFMVVPPLMLLLALISGAGTGSLVMILGIALVLFPGAARLVRTVTLEASTTGYVEAAMIRGEPLRAIMRHEVLPNVTPALVADAGVRSLGAIFLVASLNFLGVGAQPPSANWGLMIAENRQVLGSNDWALLAPAALLALLTVSLNLIGDAYTQTRDRSRGWS